MPVRPSCAGGEGARQARLVKPGSGMPGRQGRQAGESARQARPSCGGVGGDT